MSEACGVQIKSLDRDGPLYRAGLRVRDWVFAVDGEPVADEFDFSYYCAHEVSQLLVVRGLEQFELTLMREPGEYLGVEFAAQAIKRCTCRCVFCFIDQMPPGLRQSLYIKDEDYRYSFLNGNYMTLCSMNDKDLQRIIDRGISPLYISVHATDSAVRVRMLRNRFAGRIMEQLAQLSNGGIQFHAQIVVCPGYNDGAVLSRSVRDLLRFTDALKSLAIVPVGLTRHRKHAMEPVSAECAREICEKVGALSDRDQQRHGTRRVFVADEFFIKACIAIPPARYYGEYPQIENGVGLVRQLLNEAATVVRGLPAPSSRKPTTALTYCICTGTSAASYIDLICQRLAGKLAGVKFIVLPVVNRLCGEQVTVAGLLGARDVVQAIRALSQQDITVFVPQVMFNYRGHTLDGWSLERMSRATGCTLHAAGSIGQIVAYVNSRKGGHR